MDTIKIKNRGSFSELNKANIYALEEKNDSQFFSGDELGRVILWCAKTMKNIKEIAKVRGSVYALAYDSEQEILYVGSNNDGIYQINLNDNKCHYVPLPKQIYDIKIHKKNIWIALGDGEIIQFSNPLKMELNNRVSTKRARSIAPYLNKIIVGYSDHMIRIHNDETLNTEKELKGHTHSVFSVRVHPSGKYLASVGRDAKLNIWDTNADYCLRESIMAHLYTINDISFRKDGKYFATVSMDKTIKIWNAHNFQLLKVIDKDRYNGHSHSINKVLWLKFQNLLVTCSDDKSIFVWDITL